MIFIAGKNENRRIINDISSLFVFFVGLKIAVIYIVQFQIKLIILKAELFLKNMWLYCLVFGFVFNNNKTGRAIRDFVNIYIYKKICKHFTTFFF